MNKFNYESPDISILEIGKLDIITDSYENSDTTEDILDW